MQKLNIIFAFCLLLSSPVFADWLQEVNGIHSEIQALTVNRQSLGDAQRLERFFQLSYDLVMLEYPAVSQPALVIRVDRTVWRDLSEEGILRRQKAERNALALMESIERNALSEENRVNYDLLRDRLETDVRGQQFPVTLPADEPNGRAATGYRQSACHDAKFPSRRPRKSDCAH